MNTSKDKSCMPLALDTAIPKNISKYLLVLLIKGLLAGATVFILLGLIILTSHVTKSLHAILYFVLLCIIPIITTILLWALLLRISYLQLPKTREVLYIKDGHIFFCSQVRTRYNVKDRYCHIEKIIEIKKHPFVWNITADVQEKIYHGHAADSQYQKRQKEVLVSLSNKPVHQTIIQIGRFYDIQQEKEIEEILKNYNNEL